MKADARIRTADLLITNQLLYQLSYVSVVRKVCCLVAAAPIRIANAVG